MDAPYSTVGVYYLRQGVDRLTVATVYEAHSIPYMYPCTTPLTLVMKLCFYGLYLYLR